MWIIKIEVRGIPYYMNLHNGFRIEGLQDNATHYSTEQQAKEFLPIVRKAYSNATIIPIKK